MSGERPISAKAAGGYIKAESPEPLLEVNQSSFKKLMSLIALQGESRTVLAGFKSRWNGSTWMQDQDGYLQKACLAAASGTPTGCSFCRCGLGYPDKRGIHHFMTCRRPLLCPSCNLHRRVEPCEWEFLPAFKAAPFWYALTPGWQSNPRRAGLRWVTEQDEHGCPLDWESFKPWENRPDAKPSLLYSLDCIPELGSMAELAFDFAGDLGEWLSGVYAAFEWHFSFRPRASPRRGELACYHVALAHLHGFGNAPRELGFHDAKQIYRRYCEIILEGWPGREWPSYPDLWISRIPSQADLKTWINYHIKAAHFDEFYRKGIRNGCPLPDLNMEFHSVVWDALNIVRTPRKYGNLNPLVDGYIGVQQFRKLSQPQVKLLLAKIQRDDASAKELLQYDRHLLACGQQYEHKKQITQRRQRGKPKSTPDGRTL
jgi:hypothetical protein